MWSETLPAGTHAAAAARRVLRRVLAEAQAHDLLEATLLATSELVTNALVHAGPAIGLSVRASPHAVRVDVTDHSPRVPVARGYAVTSSTGRGLPLVAQLADRWGATPRPDGKSVWFEIGSFPWSTAHAEPTGQSPAEQLVVVTLKRFPVLMHWAWQEHANALLREYLLYVCEDDPSVLDRHAQASDALNVLREQLPLPDLPDDPDALLDVALEPGVTASQVALRVPRSSVPHFQTLGALLEGATRAAHEGRFLSPPTQPEVEEMRVWLCREVERQAAGGVPEAWEPRTEVRTPLGSLHDLERRYAAIAGGPEAVLATNTASVIVAVSPAALQLLGYSSPADLVGRRILVVVPTRYHQAHIAGTTLNATNGRDKLLGVPLTVPMVMADGRERPVRLLVVPRLLDGGETVFVANIAPAPGG
jgi:PAS domain S-box-containing protein